LSLANYSKIDEYNGIDHFEGPYFIIFALDFISLGTTLYTGSLLLLHTALIISNLTTWEYMRRETITYLQPFPKYYNPFDKGIIENIKIVFFHKGQI